MGGATVEASELELEETTAAAVVGVVVEAVVGGA